jgi:hypothetical protein
MRRSSFVAKSLGFKFSRTFHLRKHSRNKHMFSFTKQDNLVKISEGHDNFAHFHENFNFHESFSNNVNFHKIVCENMCRT